MPNLLEKLGLKPPVGFGAQAPDLSLASARGGGPGVGQVGSPSLVRPGGGDGDGSAPKTPAKSAEGAAMSVAMGKPPSGGGASVPSGSKPGTSPEMVAYAKERLAITRLRSELGKHKQVVHVADKTVIADAALAAAATHATTPDWPKAMAELASARTACEDGKRFADGFADYLVHRAAANVLLVSATNSGWTFPAVNFTIIPAADVKAAPPTRNYAGAKADVDSLVTVISPSFKSFYVDNVKPQVATLKALPAAGFIAGELAEIDKLVSQQETLYTARQWRQMGLNAGLIGGMLPNGGGRIAAAEKMATRRAEYDIERKKLNGSLADVAGFGKAAAAPLAAIQLRIKEADTMASHAEMQIEEAKVLLAAIGTTCVNVGIAIGQAAPYTAARATASSDLAKLRGHPAAGKIKVELDVICGVLDQAAQAAGDKGAPGTAVMLGPDLAANDFAAANVLLAQARANLATVKGLAEGLGGAAAVGDLVGDHPNTASLRKGLDALIAELATAQKAPHAALARVPFGLVGSGIAETKKQIDAKDTTAATKAIAAATDQLAAGRRIQVEHGDFMARRDLLKSRVDQHNADKAMAAKVQIKLDELTKALKTAEAAETSGDHAVAMAELNKGEAAAGAVDAAATQRAAFDKEANLAQFDLDKPANASIRAAQNQAITRARGLATVLNFDEANKIVKSVRNAMAALAADGMARKTPPDPKLTAQVQKLVDAGANDELDDLIKNLPKTVDKQVFIDLAHARFKMAIEAAEDDGNAQESIQRMCALMKDIPKDVIDNPSLKKIKRRVTREDGGVNKDGTNTQQFPFYQPNKNEVVMNSRPGQYKKPDFELGAAGRLPAREENCKPAPPKPGKDGREDLFDFNMLHELAHAIDDARNYMGQKGKEPAYGGWIEIGGKVEPIVEAVIKETGFGKTPEERQYVQDSILRNPAAPLAAFAGDKARFDKFVAAAQTDNVWDSQALTDQATLGTRVYHEGYPSTWFSYLADARKRGITSYQFRAPGEWFSELYAAWKVGKLKPSHPAVVWLQKINVKPKAKA